MVKIGRDQVFYVGLGAAQYECVPIIPLWDFWAQLLSDVDGEQ